MRNKLGFLVFGILFGFTLSRVGAGEFDLIFKMFTGEELKLAWVILIAIFVAHLGMRFLASKKINLKTKSGASIDISHKKLGQWSLLGAIIFGIGWGMSGACPGTVLTQVGEGRLMGIFTMAGMITGTYLYALLKEKKPNF